MMLIGQYDSPFVRRVGIALKIYNLPFVHQPWSVFADADRISAHNPLLRVPTLVLTSGEALIDSHIILDYLDNIAPQGRALFPVEEPARHQALKVASLATGMADKAVSLFYEKRLHDRTSDVWVKRCITQITGALRLLEQDRKARPHDHWFGADIGHADIAVAACLRFLVEAHPGLADMDDYPALAAHAARLEEMPVFRKVYQPFIAPA